MSDQPSATSIEPPVNDRRGKTFCGRCGKRFHHLDITVVIPGKIRRHVVFCERWTPPWRSE